MKAKELAALLLEYPDLEVYQEEHFSYEDGDHGSYANSVIGIAVTPSGIFFGTGDCQNDNVQTPSDCPRIHHFTIVLDDDTVFKVGSNTELYQLCEYAEYGYMSNYVSWNDNYWILCEKDIPDGHIQAEMQHVWNTHVTPDRVKYVEISVAVDPVTWEVSYERFTLEGAIQFAEEQRRR